MSMINCLIWKNLLKILINVNNKINMITDDYKHKTETNYSDKK